MQRISSFHHDKPGALYLVATPIGNLDEISERTKQVLEQVDLVACEDTRVSAKLLSHLGLHKPLIAHHQHNERKASSKILEALAQGRKVAVLSDAGYPLISDPGDFLVSQVLEENYPVIPVSGANAAINALVASGFRADHYLYYGFLDAKSSKRKKELEELRDFEWTMIFYEAPHRIRDTLADLLEVFGNRRITLARELTKLYEEFIHGTIEEVLEICESLKGEMVIVVEGASRPKDRDGAMDRVRALLDEGQSLKDACKTAAKEFGLKKNELYAKALEWNEPENPET